MSELKNELMLFLDKIRRTCDERQKKDIYWFWQDGLQYYIVDKMPFSSRDWNVVACIVLLSIVAYLVFSLLRFLFNKASDGHSRRKNRKYYARQDKAVEDENIEKYKSDIDRLSDKDYSILMYLLENENKKPYIQWGRSFGESILDSEEVFDCSPYQGTPPVIKDPVSGINLFPVADNPRQYLLKRKQYELLHFII